MRRMGVMLVALVAALCGCEEPKSVLVVRTDYAVPAGWTPKKIMGKDFRPMLCPGEWACGGSHNDRRAKEKDVWLYADHIGQATNELVKDRRGWVDFVRKMWDREKVFHFGETQNWAMAAGSDSRLHVHGVNGAGGLAYEGSASQPLCTVAVPALRSVSAGNVFNWQCDCSDAVCVLATCPADAVVDESTACLRRFRKGLLTMSGKDVMA